MKATYKHIAFAALALSAAACSQDDDFAPSYLSDPDAVRITAQVGTDDVTGGFTRSNPLGTAEEQAKFNPGDQIAVTAGSQSAVTYTLGTDGTWPPAGTDYLKWESETMDVTACYPASKNDASATTFTVPTGYADLAALADADYMTYSGKPTKGTDSSISLTMQRKMVRLVIDEIDYNNQFKNDKGEVVYSVTDIKVHANTTGYANGEPATGNIEVTAYQHEGAFYALLAPTTFELNKTFLTVTVTNNTDATDVHTLYVKNIPATEAGKSYSFSLTVGKDKLTMGEVKVTDWTGGTIDGGEAEEVLPDVDASTMTAEQVKAKVAELLKAGDTSITVKFAPDTQAEMHKAVIEAIGAQATTGAVISGDNEDSFFPEYTIYPTFADAVTNWTDGTTLTLLADVPEISEQIEISSNDLVLDLNGKSMTSTISNTLSVTGGELTIRDNAGTGSFTTTGYTVLLVNEDNAVVNFESGTLQAVRINRGVFNMTGGKIYSEKFNGIDYSDIGTVNISGGEVTSTSSDAIAHLYGTLTVSGTAKITSTNGYAIYNTEASVSTTNFR